MVLYELQRPGSVLPGLTTWVGLIGRRRPTRRDRPVVARDASHRRSWVTRATRPGHRDDMLDRSPVYRLEVQAVSRALAREVLTLLSRELESANLAPRRVSLKTLAPCGVTGLTADVRCDAPRRIHLLRFVQQAGDMPGVRSVRWMTVPPASLEDF